jgi:hypothetical protein
VTEDDDVPAEERPTLLRNITWLTEVDPDWLAGDNNYAFVVDWVGHMGVQPVLWLMRLPERPIQ